MKVNNFPSSKYTVKKMNMQATDWEGIWEIHICDKGLGPRR